MDAVSLREGATPYLARYVDPRTQRPQEKSMAPHSQADLAHTLRAVGFFGSIDAYHELVR